MHHVIKHHNPLTFKNQDLIVITNNKGLKNDFVSNHSYAYNSNSLKFSKLISIFKLFFKSVHSANIKFYHIGGYLNMIELECTKRECI